MATAKENILSRIKQALATPVPLPFNEPEENPDLFERPDESLAVIFATAFTGLQGNLIYCQNASYLPELVKELITLKNWKKIYSKNESWEKLLTEQNITVTNDLAGCDVSITGCELLVARTGTIVLSSAEQQGRTASVYAPIHICVAYAHQLVFDVKDALESLQLKYGAAIPSFISFASGPSRTADIEKTLVTGVHGPKEVYCFLVDQ